MATALNSFLGRLSVGLILGSTLMLLALNLSGPPGSPGSLNGYGYADVYAYHVREEEEGGQVARATSMCWLSLPSTLLRVLN